MTFAELKARAERLGLKPRGEYDCGHCYLYSCGPGCACFPWRTGPRRPMHWVYAKVGTGPGECIQVRRRTETRLEFRRDTAEPWQHAEIVGRITGGLMLSLI